MTSEVRRLHSEGRKQQSLALACLRQYLGLPSANSAIPTTISESEMGRLAVLYGDSCTVAATGPSLLTRLPSVASAQAAAAASGSETRSSLQQHLTQLGWMSKPADKSAASDYVLSVPQTGPLVRYLRFGRRELLQLIKVRMRLSTALL